MTQSDKNKKSSTSNDPTQDESRLPGNEQKKGKAKSSTQRNDREEIRKQNPQQQGHPK